MLNPHPQKQIVSTPLQTISSYLFQNVIQKQFFIFVPLVYWYDVIIMLSQYYCLNDKVWMTSTKNIDLSIVFHYSHFYLFQFYYPQIYLIPCIIRWKTLSLNLVEFTILKSFSIATFGDSIWWFIKIVNWMSKTSFTWLQIMYDNNCEYHRKTIISWVESHSFDISRSHSYSRIQLSESILIIEWKFTI